MIFFLDILFLFTIFIFLAAILYIFNILDFFNSLFILSKDFNFDFKSII